jgi:hypothetical protein
MLRWVLILFINNSSVGGVSRTDLKKQAVPGLKQGRFGDYIGFWPEFL